MRFIPELPLLRRELTELANRRRTYLVRVIGGVVFIGLAWFIVENAIGSAVRMKAMLGNPNNLYAGVSGMERLGIGGQVFGAMVPLLFYSVDLLMPAICCAVLTSEKERNTIGSLLLTRIGPWTILFEKLFSRLIPMGTFLLLSLPMLAYIFSLGNVDTEVLICTFYLLFLECLLIASIGLMFSAWMPTTVGSFIWTYISTLGIIILARMMNVWILQPGGIWDVIRAGGWETGNSTFGTNFITIPAGPGMRAGVALSSSVVPWVMVIGSLIVARLVLIPRAFVTPSSFLLKLFKLVDGLFEGVNNRFASGIVVVRESESLPEDAPVAWRELTRRSLGKARYLVRVLLAMEVPVLFVCITVATMSAQSDFNTLRMLLLLVWAVVILITVVKAATLISSERSRETLSALLATPMQASDILRQKVLGMRRLMIVLTIPILTIHLTLFFMYFDFQALMALISGRSSLRGLVPLLYLGFTVATTIVLSRVVIWFGTGIGVLCRTQTRAVMISTMLIAAVVLTPLAIRFLLLTGSNGQMTSLAWMSLAVEPSAPIFANENLMLQTEYGSGYYRGIWLLLDPGDYGMQDAHLLRSVSLCVGLLLEYIFLWLVIKAAVVLGAPFLLNRREQQGPYPVRLPLQREVPPLAPSSDYASAVSGGSS